MASRIQPTSFITRPRLDITVPSDREILEHHLRRLLSTKRSSFLRRRRIRSSLREALDVAGRAPRRAHYLVRHLKSQERKIRRGFLLDKEGSPNLDAAIARAVDRVLKRVPDLPGRPTQG